MILVYANCTTNDKIEKYSLPSNFALEIKYLSLLGFYLDLKPFLFYCKLAEYFSRKKYRFYL
jgi:hypothetical protein